MTIPISKIAEIHKVDGRDIAESVRAIHTKFDAGRVEIVLDFTSVLRIDPAGLREMEDLATISEETREKICLLHVNVEIYKVLKLSGLSGRFNFRT